MKSASEELHEMLANKQVGYRFTADEIQERTNFTRGSITGFIAKAHKNGMVIPAYKKKREGLRSITVYELLDPNVTWHFKPKSHGSYKGRQIKSHPQIELPLGGDQFDPSGVPRDNTIKVNYDNFVKLLHANTPSINPISSRLIDIAAEVEALERKSLSDYSTDELINEIKRRIK